MRMQHRQIVALVFVLALASGCAGVTPSPTTEQTNSARNLARQGFVAINTGLAITQETGKLASSLPLPVATKDAIDCATAKVTGTTTPATAAVVKVCGAIPLVADAPLTKGVLALQSVTSCPSLATTLAEILRAVDPLVVKLEQAGNPSLLFASVSLRAAFAFMSGMGGATCGS